MSRPSPNYIALRPTDRQTFLQEVEDWNKNYQNIRRLNRGRRLDGEEMLEYPAPPQPPPPPGYVCHACGLEICAEPGAVSNHHYHCWGAAQP